MRTCLIAAAIVFALAFPAQAQMANADCLACHDNPELTKDAGGGRTVSVHIDPRKLSPFSQPSPSLSGIFIM